jgi:transcriptional regulator with XRE-family HTH domain
MQSVRMVLNGKRIKRLRETAAALDPQFPQTMRDFARAVGINDGHLSRIESGVRYNSLPATARKIAAGLDVGVLAIADIEDVA